MIIKTSIYLDCDSCGYQSSIHDGVSYRITGPNGNVIDHVLNLKLASMADLVNVFVTDGWVLTGSRNATGEYSVHADAARLPRQVRLSNYFLVCPTCVPPRWLPPFSEHATRELQRIRLAQSEGDSEVVALREENARLRGVIDSIRSEVAS